MNGLITTKDRFSFPARELSRQLLEHLQSDQVGYWEHQFDAQTEQLLPWNLGVANDQILYSDHQVWSIDSLIKILYRYLPHIRNDAVKLQIDQLSAAAQQQAQTPAQLLAEMKKIGIVNDAQLQKAMKTKILNDLDLYLQIGSGNATFIADRDSLTQFPIEGLDPTSLLDEARQRQAIWGKIRQYVPSMNLIPILNQSAIVKANLPTWQQERIEDLVKPAQTLNSIAERMTKDNLEIAEMFGKFARIGLINLQSPKKSAPSPIMVIDDSLPILLQFQNWIAGLGYPVVVCQQPDRALSLIIEVEPAAIFIDINMPEISGFELVKQIRTQPQLAAIPLVILTGEQKLANRWRAEWSGCDFLTKPLSPASIGDFHLQLKELLLKLVGTTATQSIDQ